MEQKSKKRRLFGLLGLRGQLALTLGLMILLIFLLGVAWCKWEKVSALKTKNQEKAVMHEEWKGKKSDLEDEFHEVVQRVVKQEKVDERLLMERVEEAARKTKVRYEVEPPVTEKNGIFENHKATVRLRNTSMESLVAFDENVEGDGAANVRLDEMEIEGGRDGELSARATVSALDLVPEDDWVKEVADLLGEPELFNNSKKQDFCQTLKSYE
ncbi:MAG: hypothetical protein LBT57_03225 [Puniceicoccales bacterium]|jgi:hypothetical protein|nr:hypothetical protein [Puniceicoccales bacterium]